MIDNWKQEGWILEGDKDNKKNKNSMWLSKMKRKWGRNVGGFMLRFK